MQRYWLSDGNSEEKAGRQVKVSPLNCYSKLLWSTEDFYNTVNKIMIRIAAFVMIDDNCFIFFPLSFVSTVKELNGKIVTRIFVINSIRSCICTLS